MILLLICTSAKITSYIEVIQIEEEVVTTGLRSGNLSLWG
jgi:hypothetical protein